MDKGSRCTHGPWGEGYGPGCPTCAAIRKEHECKVAEIQRCIDNPKTIEEFVLGRWYKADQDAFIKMCEPKNNQS